MSTTEKIIEIVAEQAFLDSGEVSAASTLEELGIDSMGVVECIFAIEEKFDVQVPFNANSPEASQFDVTSIATIADAVDKLIADKKS